MTTVPVTTDVLETAAALQPPALRTLDAIHLASALAVRDDLSVVIAYDERLFEAAKQAGLPVSRPG